MSVHRYALLLLLICSCSLFKNTKKTSDEQHLSVTSSNSSRFKAQKDWSKNTSSLLFYKDSVKKDYLVQIWPKGVFTYSAEKGFYGAADSIFMKGISVEGSNAKHKQNTSEQDKGQFRGITTASDQLVSDQNHRVTVQTPSWKIIITAVIIAGLIAWYLFKK